MDRTLTLLDFLGATVVLVVIAVVLAAFGTYMAGVFQTWRRPPGDG